ncbi:MAG: hypothetical protein ACYDC8_12770 [Gammaproteobacteria bacterium]
MNKQLLSLTLAASFCAMFSLSAAAASVNNGDVLTINTGVYTYDGYGNTTSSGSYYGVDLNADHAIDTSEKYLLSQGTTGLVIGVATTPGAYHSGPPMASDTNAITAPDYFFGNTGSWFSNTPITGNTSSGLNMSDWDWAWNGIPTLNLGGLAWQPTNCAALRCIGYTFANGVGRFQWDGIYGHGYTLDTTSTVPAGDPSNFGGVQFFTHLEGTVTAITAVPIPTAMWLFGSGAIGLLGGAQRRRVA